MGNTVSDPYPFRRAVVSLHYKHHPLSSKYNSNNSGGDVEAFWRTLFCTRLSAAEFASFWTPDDVRLLRLYHPDRLAAVLLESMRQLEAFLPLSWASSTENKHEGENNNKGCSVTVGGTVDYMQTGEKGKREEKEGPVDPTAAINALRLISASLPYCFECIHKTRSLLAEDSKENDSDEYGTAITSQRTRELMDIAGRRESRFAPDFAFHFFVRGSACDSSDDAMTGEYNDSFSSPFPSSDYSYYYNSPSCLGMQLVDLLIKLFFVSGFIATAASSSSQCQAAGETPHVCKESTMEADLKLLRGLDCVSPAVLLDLLSETAAHNSEQHDVMACDNESNFRSIIEKICSYTSPVFSVDKDYRVLILRTLLLALSGPIYSSSSSSSFPSFVESTLVTADEEENHKCSQRRREVTRAAMASGIFNGQKQQLSGVLCASLLYIVRCYAKKSSLCTSSSLSSKFTPFIGSRKANFSGEDRDVLCYVLSILTVGLYSGVKIPYYYYNHYSSSDTLSATTTRVQEEGEREYKYVENACNVFVKVMETALDSTASSDSSLNCNKHNGMLEESSIHLPSHVMENEDSSSSNYLPILMEGILSLLENPLLTSVGESSSFFSSSMRLPCAPLVLHLLLWVLQRSYTARQILVERSYSTFMSLLYSLLVSSTRSTSGCGEGQITLLCLLLLVQHPSFITFLQSSLPSVASGATRKEEEEFVRILRAAMPVLPEKFVILGNNNNDNESESESGVDAAGTDSNVFCLRTYGNLLVLSMCYVLSPSSPRWFQPLYRSAVEVLHTLQVVCTHQAAASHTPHIISFPRDVLSEHLATELVSSFSHLSSIHVVSLSTETQRACIQMICLLLRIIKSRIGPLREKDGSWRSSARRVTEMEGRGIVPLLWALAVQDSLFNLQKLIIPPDESVAVHNTENADAGKLLKGEEWKEEEGLTCNGLPSSNGGNTTDGTATAIPRETVDGVDNHTHINNIKLREFIRQLTNCREFSELHNIAAAVRRGLTSMQSDSVYISEEEENKNKNTTERKSSGASAGLPNTSALQLPFKHDERLGPLGFELMSVVLRNAAQVLDDVFMHESNEAREKRGGGSVIRKVVIDSSGAGGQWLLTQLWRQVHMLNLSPPIFDYRSTLIVGE